MSLSGSDAALVVVDVQNDFFPGGALAIERADEIVPVINRLMTVARRVVGVQDWHPKDHVSFASNHEGKKPLDVVDALDVGVAAEDEPPGEPQVDPEAVSVGWLVEGLAVDDGGVVAEAVAEHELDGLPGGHLGSSQVTT